MQLSHLWCLQGWFTTVPQVSEFVPSYTISLLNRRNSIQIRTIYFTFAISIISISLKVR